MKCAEHVPHRGGLTIPDKLREMYVTSWKESRDEGRGATPQRDKRGTRLFSRLQKSSHGAKSIFTWTFDCAEMSQQSGIQGVRVNYNNIRFDLLLYKSRKMRIVFVINC